MNQLTTTEETPGRELAAVGDGPGALLTAIVQMAKDSSVDVQKLKELMLMQERLEVRQAEREFVASFQRLSADLPRVKKNGTIQLGQGKGSIPFARWEDVDAIIRPLLVREGFTLSFNSEPRPGDGGGLIVTGTLMHRAGHMRTASIPLPLDTGPGRNNLQAMGSSLAYGKRYTAEMLLNIVREGIDDDGKFGGTKFVSIEEAVELDTLIRETGSNLDRFLQHFGIAELRNLPPDKFAAAKNMLEAKRKKGPAQS